MTDVADKSLFLCSCNGTQPLDADALGRALALPEPPAVRTMLCHRELGDFTEGARGDVLVACTQEAHLFNGAAERAGHVRTIRFVNVRENGGWSSDARAATPKIAALIAAAALPEPDPVPVVTYRSSGQVLVAGPAGEALRWARALEGHAAVTVLVTSRDDGVELPATRDFATHAGALTRVAGWLGAFDVEWRVDNPIDLDACTRCNACIRACPEHAIGFDYQIDLDACRDHRACVAACGEVGAIDFEREKTTRSARFDAVVDLQRVPSLRGFDTPQGYFAPGDDVAARARALVEVASLAGEFEKPRYFAYKASICAHSRSQVEGCSACIDVCSTRAIRADGDHVVVEPHLCMGCGGCATVCPSGAMRYAFPSMPDVAKRVRTLVDTYTAAGGRDPVILLHAAQGAASIAQAARHRRGLPSAVIPVEVHHVASVGLDLWLAAIASGASRIAVLAGPDLAPSYREAIEAQMGFGETIANALGYQGEHFRLVDTDPARFDDALWRWAPPLAPRVTATFAVDADKRTTLAMAIEHLARHAPTPQTHIPLPAGAPFGAIEVAASACTMCLACVGACPVGALADGQDTLELRFIESRCVQCGICEATCPEHAITLRPGLCLEPSAKALRVLNAARVAACTRCGKALGAAKLIDDMVARLATHSMFATPEALARLRMCADCRVIDQFAATAR